MVGAGRMVLETGDNGDEIDDDNDDHDDDVGRIDHGLGWKDGS